MTNETRDISQLRAQLKDYILDSETEIRENLKVGIFRGQNDPTVVKMQKVVDDLIARVREDGYKVGYSAAMEDGWGGYAAALRDGIAAIEEQQRLWKEDTLTRIGLGIAKAAIEALGGER